jgi:hypothetical protein
MRKFLAVTLSLSASVLAGCAGQTGIGSTPLTGDVLAKAKQVQAYAVTACKFEPYLASVVSIINAGAGTTVGAVGDAVCNAVTTLPLADGPGDRKPRVAGVVVRGKFVR